MKIEIIAVGSELLTPYYLDTNSLFLTRRLNDFGLDPAWKTVVGDDPSDLKNVFADALGRADLLLVMGGLGPTGDDITREVLAEVLGRSLKFEEKILAGIRDRIARHGREMTASNRKQAYVIEGAEVLENRNGTAPGQWLAAGRKLIALLPGPPRELEPMFDALIRPRLAPISSGVLLRRTLKTTGLGESQAEDMIRDLYPDQKDLRLTILASPGQVEFHLSARSASDAAAAREALDRLTEALRSRLAERVFSDSGEDLEEVVGRMLKASGKTLAAAESCTGGLLAERITRVSGSSAYFLEGAVSYANAAKTRVLGVPAGLIEARGAVSAEVAAAMAAGIRAVSGADFGLSITGIAGPDGGTPEKPRGLVFNGISWDGGGAVERNVFFGGRAEVRFQAAQKALDQVRIRCERESRRKAGP